MWTEEDMWQALRDCYDPELALNVVELGRVMDVAVWVDEDAPGAGIAGVRPRQRVKVRLLGDPEDEEHKARLQALVENRLLGLEGLSGVEVAVVDEPKWTPARISAAGRKLLGLDGVVFPILNNRVRG